MQKGFKKVVPDLIRGTPGLTDNEYAKMALDRGLCGSDSKKGESGKVFALATTLRKEVREKRMHGIKAVKVDGKLHFFPENGIPKDPLPIRDKSITVLLPPDVTDATDTLIEVDNFKNHSEALVWLAREGIKAKSLQLEQKKKVVEQIKQLKQSVSI